jgi:hypothetical protein
VSHKKTDKFFIYAAPKKGSGKGRRLLGVNYAYEGGAQNVTVQDLMEFLNENKIELSAVVLGSNFSTYAKVG